MAPSILTFLSTALDARFDLFETSHQTAFRLFSGFYEGEPKLLVDLFAKTLVVYNYANPHELFENTIEQVIHFYLAQMPWLEGVVLKTRHSPVRANRKGKLVWGAQPTKKVFENGVWYAVDLCMNQDSSFYLDTRLLRTWAQEGLRGQTVLNTFAYTGSLGVAAGIGAAKRVIHLDRNRKFLDLAKASYRLNNIPVVNDDFIAGDFFSVTAQLRRMNTQFDCVFIDPPFFSSTPKGRVDLIQGYPKLINKVRPLVKDGGRLVAVNNALYVSGKDYLNSLGQLCQDGYIFIEEIIEVPADITGYPETRLGYPPVDPAPFNHPTKIVILRVHRKAA